MTTTTMTTTATMATTTVVTGRMWMQMPGMMDGALAASARDCLMEIVLRCPIAIRAVIHGLWTVLWTNHGLIRRPSVGARIHFHNGRPPPPPQLPPTMAATMTTATMTATAVLGPAADRVLGHGWTQ